MAKDKVIDVVVFGLEIGKLGYDPDQGKSFFQYNPEFFKRLFYSKNKTVTGLGGIPAYFCQCNERIL